MSLAGIEPWGENVLWSKFVWKMLYGQNSYQLCGIIALIKILI